MLYLNRCTQGLAQHIRGGISVILFFLLLTASFQNKASAIPPVLRPSTRPWFATLGFGPAVQLDSYPSQVKFSQDIGYHFSGNGQGPAIGGSTAESFSNGFTTLQIGPKFWWDIQIVQNLGLYVTPFVQAGYAGAFTGNGYYLGPKKTYWVNGASEHFFNMQFGADVRLALDNRWMAFVRPLGLDFFINGNFLARADVFMMGGGVTF